MESVIKVLLLMELSLGKECINMQMEIDTKVIGEMIDHLTMEYLCLELEKWLQVIG